ncbi:superoxide dismutase family protein [Carnimonas nigrificans]|uniref:superoxide dismutase family protein n=1 Tax=Carnimonas nigrificans TaxID=64323 RepID=UPI0004B17869|nr:superoxide dismutase family protein [Carnimonas nigrificans]
MKRHLIIASLMMAAGTSTAFAAEEITAPLLDGHDTNIGQVTVSEIPSGVILRVEAKNLTPGWHGMHFHEQAECKGPDFTSSGSHVHNADKVVHGVRNAEANDNGDLPNLYVNKDGSATVELFSPLVSLTPGDSGDTSRPALLDSDGSALVIHAQPDDYQSQPIGGSGDRVACASLNGDNNNDNEE